MRDRVDMIDVPKPVIDKGRAKEGRYAGRIGTPPGGAFRLGKVGIPPGKRRGASGAFDVLYAVKASDQLEIPKP